LSFSLARENLGSPTLSKNLKKTKAMQGWWSLENQTAGGT